MKEDIDEFKGKNGNVTYTVKELLYGLNNKVDKLREEITCLETKNVSIKSTLKYQWLAIGSLFALALYIIEKLIGNV